MTDARHGLEQEAPPPPGRRRGLTLFFATAGAGLAWFVQLNTNYGLLSQPCYPGPERKLELPVHAQWVWPVTLILYAACLLVALLSLWTAIRLYRRARAGDPQGRDSRDCFLGYSGIIMGVGFSFVIAANLLALILVPPCAL